MGKPASHGPPSRSQSISPAQAHLQPGDHRGAIPLGKGHSFSSGIFKQLVSWGRNNRLTSLLFSQPGWVLGTTPGWAKSCHLLFPRPPPLNSSALFLKQYETSKWVRKHPACAQCSHTSHTHTSPCALQENHRPRITLPQPSCFLFPRIILRPCSQLRTIQVCPHGPSFAGLYLSELKTGEEKQLGAWTTLVAARSKALTSFSIAGPSLPGSPTWQVPLVPAD